MPVFIHNGLRTPIGVVNGQYKSIRPELLGAKVLNQLFDSKKASSWMPFFVAMQLVLVGILLD